MDLALWEMNCEDERYKLAFSYSRELEAWNFGGKADSEEGDSRIFSGHTLALNTECFAKGGYSRKDTPELLPVSSFPY